MGIFPDSLISEVLQHLGAEAVLQKIHYRPEMIQSSGQGIRCFCPIHKETIFRTLIVDRKSKSYRCSNYSCPGAGGGDLIDLYARSRGLSYEQAVMELCRVFEIGVDLSVADQYLNDSLEVAHNYLELGVLAEAEEHFERILKFKENCLPALEGLIRVYEATERPEAHRAARLRLAYALSAQEKVKEALAILKQCVQEKPEDTETRLFYIDCLRRGGQTEQAAQEYLGIAGEMAARGEVERALEVYRTAAALEAPGVDVAACVIGLLAGAGRREEAIAEGLGVSERRLKDGDAEGAAEALDAAIKLDPTREDLYLRLAGLVAQSCLDGAHLTRVCERIKDLLDAGNYDTARQALELLEEAYPGRPALMLLRADLEEAHEDERAALDLRLKCVDEYERRLDFDAALGVMDQILGGKTNNVPLLSRKANLLCQMERSDEAVQTYLEIVDLFRQADEFEHAAAVYQTIIDLDPTVIEHRENQLDLYLQLGMEPVVVQRALALCGMHHEARRFDQANRIIERALRTVPQSPDLLLYHGEILQEWDRRGEAAEQFLAVGRIFLAQEELDLAHQAVERSLKCVPEHLEARETFADVLTQKGQTLHAMSIYLDLGEFYLREKESEKVIGVARKVLAIQPEHLPSLLMLSRGLGMAGQHERQLSAQTQLVNLYMKGQSYTRATEICEEILSRHDDYTPALEQLVAIAQSTRQGGQSVKYLWKLAQVHARGGRREQEQGVLEQILARDPLHGEAWARYLELLMLWSTPQVLGEALSTFIQHHEEAGRSDEALEVLESLCRTANPKPEVFAGMARVYQAKGDTEGVKAALRTQAELLGRLMRDPEALEAWDKLAGLQPEDVTIRRTRVEIMLRNNMMDEVCAEYRRLASVLAGQKRYEEAELALLEVLNLDSRDMDARGELISVFIKTRDFTRAAEQIEEGAGRLVEEERYAEAIKTFERMFEFDPAHDETWRKIIAIHQRMGELEGALEAYGRLLDCLEAKDAASEFEQAAQEAIQLQPGSWDVRRRLAAFYAYHGRQTEAEGVFLTLAVRQIEAGQEDEAEKTLEKILEFNPNSVPARAHHAEILARKGMTAEALTEFMSLTGALATATLTGPAARGENPNTFRMGSYEGIRLIKDYTFETFIVGSRNNFAHATAMAVCRAPAKNYNPLFLYSDVGLGKTHLCHAIAHYIIDRQPQMKVLYTTTEDFVGELIDAIQGNSISNFRNRHKLIDVLLVDDVQFLSGKERAQEEFFNVFNAIFQAGKQVVLTSDRPPKDISHLEKRLKSRFGAGIIVDIQSPDLETRQAILKHELEARGKSGAISDEILLYVAEQIESNVRDLKGALNQLVARQDLSGIKVDLVLARQVLSQHMLTA